MLTGVDLFFVCKELKALVGARVKKIYSSGEDLFFHFYNHGEKKVLKILQGKAIFLSGKETHDDYPSNFCMILRKYLMNAVLESIKQRGFERVVEFVFSKQEKFSVVVEFIRPGNTILCNEERMIIFPLKILSFSSRRVRPKEKYSAPEPKKGFDSLTESDKDSVVKALAMDMGFGGSYSEEILKRAGLPKTLEPKSLTANQVSELQRISDEMLNEEIDASISDKPYPIKMKSQASGKKYESFSMALDEFYRKTDEPIVDKNETIKSSIIGSIGDFEAKSKEYRNIAEYIMNNFDDIDRLFKGLLKAKDEYGWYALKGMLEEHRGYETSMVESYLPDERKIVITGGIELDLTRSVGENLNSYYELAKKYESKRTSALGKVRQIEKQKPKVPKKILKKDPKWYQKFHWFFSSSGFLVISGRNAGQNEEIIKKYMEQEDRVLHADMSGSPFTLIKKGKNADSKTISEAAQFTAAYSRAWENDAVIDVFCVYPEQVRTSAPSGEYLSRGSFMIYGKKKLIKGLKLVIAVGFDKGIFSGPPDSVRKRTKYYMIVYPGRETPENTAKKIKQFLEKGVEYKISVDDIVKVLPGNCRLMNLSA